MVSVESKLNGSLEVIAFLERENIQLKTRIHQERIAHAATERKYILRDSGLPVASVNRLNDAFKSSTDNTGLKEAINCERRTLR
jgi:hypothetical protein